MRGTGQDPAARIAGGHQVGLQDAVRLAGWPTPRQADGEKNVRSAAGSASEMERKGGPQDMSMAVSLAGWPTPTSRDHKDGAPCQNVPINALLGRTAWLSGWSTLMANDSERRGQVAPSEKTLNNNAALAGWPTPSTPSGGQTVPEGTTATGRTPDGRKLQVTLGNSAQLSGPIRYTVHGEMLTGSSAAMPAGGQLNPALPRWLMAFPAEWERSAPGWSSWSIWQDVMHAAYVMQSDTASGA